MRWKAILGVTLLAACSAAWSGPEDKLSGNDVFTTPKKEFDFGKLKYLKKSDTLIIPTVVVRLQNWGTKGAVSKTRGASSTQTAQARSTMSVAVDPKVAQELAPSLQNDLVEKMTAAVWKVLTETAFRDRTAYNKLQW